MSNVYVHFSLISFSARYSVVNFQLESHSLRFREVIRYIGADAVFVQMGRMAAAVIVVAAQSALIFIVPVAAVPVCAAAVGLGHKNTKISRNCLGNPGADHQGR